MGKGLLLGVYSGAGSPPPPPVDPTSYPGLLVWLKADGTLYQNHTGTGAVTANGDPVGYLFDHSGNGRHHTRHVASQRPVYRPAFQNGLPVLEFDGVDDFVTPVSNITGSGFEVFVVLRLNSDPPTSSGTSGLWYYSTAGAQAHYPFVDGIIYDNFGSTTRHTTVNPTPSLTNWHYYNVTSIAGEWTSRLNGVQIFTTSTNTVGMSTAVSTALGDSGISAFFFSGYWAELFIYNRKLTNAERTALNNYVATKWGIS